jgi:cob(I)alamin adenosyltransferase
MRTTAIGMPSGQSSLTTLTALKTYNGTPFGSLPERRLSHPRRTYGQPPPQPNPRVAEERLLPVATLAFEDFETKESVVVVYTGEGKGKTSAGLGLLGRALGNRWNVAFVQFIKYWGVGEHAFIRDIMPLYKDQLYFYKGGKGFYDAGELSEQQVSPEQHKQAAAETYAEAYKAATSGQYQLVICDEINNAAHDGLLTEKQLENLITKRAKGTSLCLTGRNFPKKLLKHVDIATNMTKIKHHFDDKFLANKGIDF